MNCPELCARYLDLVVKIAESLRTILLMWWLRLQYAFGVAPARLARAYRRRGH